MKTRYLSENDVLSVQPRSRCQCDKELRSICVRSCKENIKQVYSFNLGIIVMQEVKKTGFFFSVHSRVQHINFERD